MNLTKNFQLRGKALKNTSLALREVTAMYNQLIIEKYKAKRFIIMYLAAIVLAAAGFFLGLLKLPENLDTATVFSLSICDTSLCLSFHLLQLGLLEMIF